MRRGGSIVAGDRRLANDDELDRNDVAALMQRLEVSVLRVRPRLAPDDRAGRERSAPPLRSTSLPLLSISSCCR